MSQFLFLNGQIRALESKLLTVGKLDRMVGAETPEDAFRVMTELQYAEYFDDTVTAKDFPKIIEQGLQETKELILKGAGNHKGFSVLFTRFDVNNIKRAFKKKHLEGAKSIEILSEDDGFSPLGDLSLEGLNDLVFNGRASEEVSSFLVSLGSVAEEAFVSTNDFLVVEQKIDQAYACHLQSLTKGSSGYYKKLVELMLNMNIVRCIARSILIHKQPLDESLMCKSGLASESLKGIDTLEKMAVLMRQYEPFVTLSRELSEDKSDHENLARLEQGLDEVYIEFMEESARGEIDTIQIALSYFERRLRDARRLKFIMFSKFNGFDAETIYKALGTL